MARHHGFWRARGGVRVRFEPRHAAVLRDLLTDVASMLEPDDGGAGPAGGAAGVDADPLERLLGIGSATTPPEDPALRRLLPDAHRDDPEASAEFRRYTEQSLRERKVAGLHVAVATLARDGDVQLTPAEASAWLVALTDVRLVLGERLGLRSDEDHELLVRMVEHLVDSDLQGAEGSPGERTVVLLSLYEHLTMLQAQLVDALSHDLPA